MLNRLRLHRKIWADRRSTALLEFAFLAPILVLLLFGVYELSSAITIYQETYNAAHSIPASASSMAEIDSGIDNGATNLSYQQVQLAESEIWAQIPSLRSGFRDPVKSVTITSVTFLANPTTCVPSPTTSCNYLPYVVWSVAYKGGDSGRTFQNGGSNPSALRSCTAAGNGSKLNNVVLTGLLHQTSPTAGASSDLTNLRTLNLTTGNPTLSTGNANQVPPSPILVVDVHMRYVPIFSLFMTAPIDFWSNGFWPVRSVQANHTVTVNGVATQQAYTLSQQFTTIKLSSLANATVNVDYCINNSINNPGPTT